MTSSAPALDLVARSSALREAAASLRPDPLLLRDLDDSALLLLQGGWADASRTAGSHLAAIAGEIARRSDRALGSGGLAQRSGFRSPEELVKVSTGLSRQEAITVVRVGRVVEQNASGGVLDPLTGELTAPREPWLAAAGAALVAGTLSSSQLTAIRTGLGQPTGNVPIHALTAAVVNLVTEITTTSTTGSMAGVAGVGWDVDRVLLRAREVRDAIDETGIGDREQERYESRSLRLFTRPNGTRRVVWDLDDETGALVEDLHDRLTSPKRGGIRFVDPTLAAQAETIRTDQRSVEQLASDGFAHLLTTGANTNTNHLLGSGAPQIRILVNAHHLHPTNPDQTQHTPGQGSAEQHGQDAAAQTPTVEGDHGFVEAQTSAGQGSPGVGSPGVGHGFIEGQPSPISLRTIERLACTGEMIIASLHPDGQPLDLGRDARLFTPKQRTALAIRDGGCRWTGCDRPPTWTEAHHLKHWQRDHGNTNIADGILLCKYHHLLLHRDGWELTHTKTTYHLIPPKNIDPHQTPIPLESKSRAWKEFITTHPDG